MQCVQSGNSEIGMGWFDHFLERVKKFIPERARSIYGEV